MCLDVCICVYVHSYTCVYTHAHNFQIANTQHAHIQNTHKSTVNVCVRVNEYLYMCLHFGSRAQELSRALLSHKR